MKLNIVNTTDYRPLDATFTVNLDSTPLAIRRLNVFLNDLSSAEVNGNGLRRCTNHLVI